MRPFFYPLNPLFRVRLMNRNVLTSQNITEKTDAELLALSLEHPVYFEIIVNKYRDDFLRKITFMLKSKTEAEDVVQDTFVKIYIHAAKFKVQENASFKSWAYKILINTCYTYCQKRKKERIFVNNLDSDILDESGSLDPAFAKMIDKDRFLSVVTKLPNTFARILRLGVIEGKSQEEIAEAEQISVGAVRTRMHRAKNEFEKFKIL
jgi:RNA polymerase sigma-70 factor (ECF subfamily)